MSTIGDIIKEKKKNFYNYLIKIIEDEKISSKLSKEHIINFRKYTNRLIICSEEEFIYFVSTDLFQYKGNADLYVDKLLKDLNINDLDITEYKQKIIDYINLFIDIIEYSMTD